MGFDALFGENSPSRGSDAGLRRIADATKSPQPSAPDLHQFKTKAPFPRLY
jgi:hypothetical protein